MRHEYFRGEIYTMGGGSHEHAAMAAAITTALGRQLDGHPCRVYRTYGARAGAGRAVGPWVRGLDIAGLWGG